MYVPAMAAACECFLLGLDCGACHVAYVGILIKQVGIRKWLWALAMILPFLCMATLRVSMQDACDKMF
jgi:hypothetical protein